MGERRVLGTLSQQPWSVDEVLERWVHQPEGWLDLKLEDGEKKMKSLMTCFLKDLAVLWWLFIFVVMKNWSAYQNWYCLSILRSLDSSFRISNWGEAMKTLRHKWNTVEKIYCSKVLLKYCSTVNTIIYWKNETKYLGYLSSKWRLSWLTIWFWIPLNIEGNPIHFVNLWKTRWCFLWRGIKRHYAFLKAHSLS